MNRRVEGRPSEKTKIGRPKYKTEKTGDSKVSPLVYTAMEKMVTLAEEMKQKVESGELTPEQAASDVFSELNRKSTVLKKLEDAKGRGWHPAIKGAEDDPNPLYKLWGELKQRVRDEEDIVEVTEFAEAVKPPPLPKDYTEMEDKKKDIRKTEEDIVEVAEFAEAIEPPPLPTDDTEIEDTEKAEAVKEKIKQIPTAQSKRPKTTAVREKRGPIGGTTVTYKAQRREKDRGTGLSYEEKPIESSKDLHMILELDYGNAVKIKPDGTVKKGWFGRNKKAFDKLYTKDPKFKKQFDEFQESFLDKFEEKLWFEDPHKDKGDKKLVLEQTGKMEIRNKMNKKEKAEAQIILDLFQADGAKRVREYIKEGLDGRVPARVAEYLSDFISEDELFGTDKQVVEDEVSLGEPLKEENTKGEEKKAA